MSLFSDEKMNKITMENIAENLPQRLRETHKGDYGRILIIAGSEGMMGAAIMCAKGAFRSGAGLVFLSAKSKMFPIIHGAIPEVICKERGLEGYADDYDAIAIGPGMENSENTAKVVRMYLGYYKKTLVIDADGLNSMGGDLAAFAGAKGKCIITPHPGEAARLLGISTKEIGEDRVGSVRMLAEKTGAVTVLKGALTLVASPDGQIACNSTGNPGMATGGSGDVLTGIIASFAGQGMEPFEAAKTGVFIHGLAGDIGADAFGEYGLMAGDIAEMTAFAIKKVSGER